MGRTEWEAASGRESHSNAGCEVHYAEEAFVDWSKVMGIDEVRVC